MIELQQHGQDDYMGWKLKVYCRVSDLVSKLGDLAKKMEQDLNEWKTAVSQQRQRFYHLNYFTAQQLLVLRKELNCFRNSSSIKAISPEIMALLQSISRNVKEQDVFNTFNKLHLKQQASKISEVSEENMSYHSSMVSNDLESMVVETPSSLPEPRMSVSDLSDVQKSILFNLNQNNEFNLKLILLAFDKCPEPEGEEAVESWCIENQQTFPYDDRIEDDRSDTVSMKSSDLCMETESTAHHLINEHHPTVKEFINAGIDRRLAINAVKQYPDDPVAAMNCCLTDEDNEFFDISDETAEHLFGDDHQMLAENNSIHSDHSDQPSHEYNGIDTQDSMDYV